MKQHLIKTSVTITVLAVAVLGIVGVNVAQGQTEATASSTTTTTTTTSTPSVADNSRAIRPARPLNCDPLSHHWPAYVVGEGGMEEADLQSIYNTPLKWNSNGKFIYFIWQTSSFFGNNWVTKTALTSTTDTIAEGTIISIYCTEAVDQTRLDRLNLLHGHTEVSLTSGLNVIVAPETITRQPDQTSSFLFGELLTNCQTPPLLPAGIITLQIRNLENGHWSYSNLCDREVETRVVNTDPYYEAVSTIHQGDIIYVDFWACEACGFGSGYDIHWNAGSRRFERVIEHVENPEDSSTVSEEDSPT